MWAVSRDPESPGIGPRMGGLFQRAAPRRAGRTPGAVTQMPGGDFQHALREAFRTTTPPASPAPGAPPPDDTADPGPGDGAGPESAPGPEAVQEVGSATAAAQPAGDHGGVAARARRPGPGETAPGRLLRSPAGVDRAADAFFDEVVRSAQGDR